MEPALHSGSFRLIWFNTPSILSLTSVNLRLFLSDVIRLYERQTHYPVICGYSEHR